MYAHAPSKKKSDALKNCSYAEKEQVFNYFSKHHENSVSLNVKLGRENIFKPTIGNESLHQDNNDNCVRIVKYATSNSLVVKSTRCSAPKHS